MGILPSTPACPGLLVVVGFSCGPPLLLFGVPLSSQDLLVVKLSPLCWLLAVRGEREGLSEQRALGCFRFTRMRLRLLYLCLCAWPPCCRSIVGVVVFRDLLASRRACTSSSITVEGQRPPAVRAVVQSLLVLSLRRSDQTHFFFYVHAHSMRSDSSGRSGQQGGCPYNFRLRSSARLGGRWEQSRPLTRGFPASWRWHC